MRRLAFIGYVGLVALTLFAVACGGSGDVASDESATVESPATESAAETPLVSPETPAETDDEPGLEDTKGEGETEEAPAERMRFVAPIRGVAEVGYLSPDTKAVNDEIVTTIRIKNISTGAIAGFRLDEFWWDAAGNPLPGDSQRLRRPLMPGEEAAIELRVPRDEKMTRNSYQFSHANGEIKAKLMTAF